MSNLRPNHIAIVMDGNGRWAESKNLPRFEGHQAGVEAAKSVVKFCLESNIKHLSLFAFSSENWSRPSEEVDFLMQLFIDSLESFIPELNENGVKVRFIGNRKLLKKDLQEKIVQAEYLTENNNKLVLVVAVNYGGRWDIIQAVNQIISCCQSKKTQEELSEVEFNSFLSTKDLPDPDLLIRTSGEKRISNFYLWQLAYSELYFVDKYWPEFSRDDFEKALFSFSQRHRRYGNIATNKEEKDN